MKKGQPNSSRRSSLRPGIATVELAVCMPMLMLLVFGSIQACDVLFLKHATTTAAYQGTLEAAKDNATSRSVKARAVEMLEALRIQGGEVKISPRGDLASMEPGVHITVTVSAPSGPNIKGPKMFTTPNEVESSGVTMR